MISMINAGVKWIFLSSTHSALRFHESFFPSGVHCCCEICTNQPSVLKPLLSEGCWYLVVYSAVALDYHSAHQFYYGEDCIVIVMMLMYLTRQEQKTNEGVLYCLIYIILCAAVGDWQWRSVIIPCSKLFKLYADKSPTMLIFDVYTRTY